MMLKYYEKNFPLLERELKAEKAKNQEFQLELNRMKKVCRCGAVKR